MSLIFFIPLASFIANPRTERNLAGILSFYSLARPDRTGVDIWENTPAVEKGTCADVMKHLLKEVPEILAPYINDLIDYINYDVTRVKWGIPEAIGNLAAYYPEEVEPAIPKLIANTKDASTVVRWCAAYALTEIAQYNKKAQKVLIPRFGEIIKKEKNNGVKNVYLKMLKKDNNL